MLSTPLCVDKLLIAGFPVYRLVIDIPPLVRCKISLQTLTNFEDMRTGSSVAFSRHSDVTFRNKPIRDHVYHADILQYQLNGLVSLNFGPNLRYRG